MLRIAPATARIGRHRTKQQWQMCRLCWPFRSWPWTVQWYDTTRIARWRRFMAFLKATTTTHHHWESTHSNSINRTCLPLIWGVHFISKSLKKGSSCPNNNRGMTHQSDEKHLNYMTEYCVGVVKLALYCYNICFLLCVINHSSS